MRTAWIGIDLCRLGNRTAMVPEAVEKKFRKLLNIGEGAAAWPPPVGHLDVSWLATAGTSTSPA